MRKGKLSILSLSLLTILVCAASAQNPTASLPAALPTNVATPVLPAPIQAGPMSLPASTAPAAIVPVVSQPDAKSLANAMDSLAINEAAKNVHISSKDKSLSFNFQDIPVKTLLQVVAKNTGLNFVISDSVKGNMSLSLQNVTWQKALDVVMRANGLDSRRYDNVMIIGPIDELAANDVKRLQAQQQVAALAQPISTIIHLHYANADDLAAVIKGQQSSLLSANGQIGTDPRTNTIWMRDNQENLNKIRTFIQQLDVPAKQVLIEARIVSLDTKYAKELGVRWGISNMRNLSGTLKGANKIRGGTGATAVDPYTDRLNFNLPAQSSGVFGAQPSSIGLALLHLGKGYLDLELSALEGEQHGQIISNPRVITSNLQKATIQTGEEIPYQEATSSGATSVSYKKAVLSLEITPQITSDNNVVLNLKVAQNKRGENVSTGSTTVPAIDTQEVQSYVLLKNGETIVIGGVYKQTKNDTYERVPFFGSLPVVGGMFRYKHEDTARTELLIFITPKLVTESSLAVLSPNEDKLNKLSLEVDNGVSSKTPMDDK